MWKLIFGFVDVEITSGDTVNVLQRINHQGVSIFDVYFVDDFCVRGTIARQDINKLKALIHRYGDDIKFVRRKGIHWTLQKAYKRPLLLLSLVLLLVLSLYLPSRLLFVRVEGNNKLPDTLILERAADCGIRFGASRKEVRSEKVKNALIGVMPELQWVGINTSGCVATISVREKALSEEEETDFGVSSIVASRDGIISSFTVEAGTPLCQIGEAVKAGQTLVSGYTNCGIAIRAGHANAEIMARTLHDIRVLAPENMLVRVNEIKKETNYSLLVGKKLINFFKDSGISNSTCVKIYTKDYLTLPGGFELPIALVTQTVTYYAVEYDCVDSREEDRAWVAEYARDYLQTQMIAGRILSENIQMQKLEELCVLDGMYICHEMIGRVRNEVAEDYGQTN